MRNLFINRDGRLRTSRVSLVLFLGLLLSLSLLFYLQKPVDKAVVVVRHIFTAPTPEKKPQPAKEPTKQPQKQPPKQLRKAEVQPRPESSRTRSVTANPKLAEPQPAPAPPSRTARSQEDQERAVSPQPVPAPQSHHEKTRLAEAVAAAAVVAQKKAEKPQSPAPAPPAAAAEVVESRTPAPVPSPAPKTMQKAAEESLLPTPVAPVKSAEAEKDAPAPEAVKSAVASAASDSSPRRIDLRSAELARNLAASETSSPLPATAKPRVVFKPLPASILTSAAESEKKATAPTRLIAEEEVEDLQQQWQEKSEKNQSTAVSLLSTKARAQLLHGLSRQEAGQTRKPAAANASPKVSLPAEFAAPGALSAKPETASGIVAGPKRALPVSAATQNPDAKASVSGTPPEITVSKAQYYKLHKAWRQAGKSDRNPDRLIPLRIENLRQAYNFLQMKPVVLRSDGSCIDLSDGRHLPPASLDRFSAIVIRVSEPWEKWGTELKRAGLRPGDKFEVRYYLYDFVRRALYARVNQAYDWARQRGLLASATRPDEVDVLGRAYVVSRSGGGSFGVFVPRFLSTRNGRTVKIDPQAFGPAPEVAALRQAGVI